MEVGTYIAVGSFMAGVIFTLGRYSARVERLEEWRRELERRFDDLDGHLHRIEREIVTSRP